MSSTQYIIPAKVIDDQLHCYDYEPIIDHLLCIDEYKREARKLSRIYDNP